MSSLFLLSCVTSGFAATINWSASIDNGLSLADGTNLAAGSLVRVGYFTSGGVQLTDAQIQALASSPSTLNSSFIEVGTTTIGTGVGSIAGHFSASSIADTGSSGLNVAGNQIYVWVFNASTLGAATQQGIFYWLNTNTATNPDSTPETPGARWSFPAQDPPGITTIDHGDGQCERDGSEGVHARRRGDGLVHHDDHAADGGHDQHGLLQPARGDGRHAELYMVAEQRHAADGFVAEHRRSVERHADCGGHVELHRARHGCEQPHGDADLRADHQLPGAEHHYDHAADKRHRRNGLLTHLCGDGRQRHL